MNWTKLFNLPLNASTHADQVDQVIGAMHILMFVLFFGWLIFFTVVLFKFRRSKNKKASYHGTKSHFSTYVEVGVVCIEAAILLLLAIPAWGRIVVNPPLSKDRISIRVVAEQYAWNIHYQGLDNNFGTSKTSLISAENPVGLDRESDHGEDDILTINQLHIPVNRQISILLSSKDVIHSFFLPEMRVKQDVVPGHVIPISFTANKTGNFEIACAQLCGLGHYRMRGFFVVHTATDYDNWLAERRAELAEEAAAETTDDFW